MATDDAYTVPFTVSISRCMNFKPSRQDVQMTSFVRVEFGSRTQSETSRVPLVAAEKTAQYDAQITFAVSAPTRYAALDEIAHKPIVLTIVECVPKDKKAKEDKTNVVGQASVDLLPLLRGQSIVTGSQAVFPAGSVEIDFASDSLPQIEYSVAPSSPLLSDVEIKEGNVFSVRIDSMYSIPEGWAPGGGYTFTVSLPVPIAKATEATVVLPQGQVKVPSDRDPPMRRWSYVGTAQGMSQLIQGSEVRSIPYEDEDGDLKSARHVAFRREAERSRPRVAWNSERRCRLDANACATFQSLIAKSRVWPVEIFRLPVAATQPGGGGGGGSKQKEDPMPTYHGIAYVNLTPLLYPGATRLRGAYPIQPYVDSEVSEKTKRSLGTSTLDVAMRSISVAGTRSIASARGNRKKSAILTPKPSSTFIGTGTQAEVGTEAIPEFVAASVDSRAYVESKSYVVVEISMDRPFVEKRSTESLARMVRDVVPPRAAFPKRRGGADAAIGDFHREIARVASHVLDEFRSAFGEKLSQNELALSSEAAAHRRKQLVYHLNTSGKYHLFKEQLKRVVVNVVREKFAHKKSFRDATSRRAFLGQLYVFLVDEMHRSLAKTFTVDSIAAAAVPAPASPVDDDAVIKHFAREAEVNFNYELAERFYQERLARDVGNADHWVDYGRFALLIGDRAKAAECFREAVSLDQRHAVALLMYAIVAADRNDVAETFLESATTVDVDAGVVTWTIVGLYYEMTHDDVRAEMAFIEARRANAGRARAAAARRRRLERDDVSTETDVIPPPPPPVEIFPDQPAADRKSSTTLAAVPRGLTASNVSAAKSPLPAQPSIVVPSSPEIVVDEEEETGESIFLQAAYFLLEMQATDWAAKALEHEFVDASTSASYCIALACVNTQRKRYDQARANLTEALVYDYQNPDTWAQLGHVEYLTGNREEAKAAYERVLDFISEASDMHTVYLRLGSLYIQEEQYEGAKHTFLLACKRSPTAFSWLGVGIACYRMGDLSEAEDALCEANILNNADPEVWGYLAMVCLRSARKVEAEQAYKYALKVNLSDEKLLEEIGRLQDEVGFGDPAK